MNDKLLGGLWGLLVGDALGVSYEFKAASSIPPYEEIEMTPPAGYPKTYSHIPPGTWSDDGAQALCLLASLMECHGLDLRNFADKLLLWADEGLFAVDNVVFDIGNQTARALNAYRKGVSPEESGNIPNGKGNGALMRVLPAVIWCEINGKSNTELIDIAQRQCLVTHGHLTNQICCAIYCLTSRNLLSMGFDNAYATAYTELKAYYQSHHDYLNELHKYFAVDMIFHGAGSGYVVDSLYSAFMILKRAVSYEDAIKQAVALGDDTDTTACITGGAAGMLFGYSNIPSRWLEQLRGKEIIRLFL